MSDACDNLLWVTCGVYYPPTEDAESPIFSGAEYTIPSQTTLYEFVKDDLGIDGPCTLYHAPRHSPRVVIPRSEWGTPVAQWREQPDARGRDDVGFDVAWGTRVLTDND